MARIINISHFSWLEEWWDHGVDMLLFPGINFCLHMQKNWGVPSHCVTIIILCPEPLFRLVEHNLTLKGKEIPRCLYKFRGTETFERLKIIMISLSLVAVPLLVAAFVVGTVLRRLRARSIAYLPGPPPGPWLVGMASCRYCDSRLPTNHDYQEIFLHCSGPRRWATLILHGRGSTVMLCASKVFLVLSPIVFLGYEHQIEHKSIDRGRCCSLQTPRCVSTSHTHFFMLWYVDSIQALQYIFNTSAYQFSKLPENRASSALTTGKGIVWAEGCCRCLWNHISSYLFISAGMQHARQRKIMNPAFSYGALRGFLPVFHGTAQRVRDSLSVNRYLIITHL